MRWFRIGLLTLAGIVAILLTAVMVLISIDLGMFKDRVEVLVTDLLARELRIDGELHAYVGTSVELYAEDVFIANPEWADDDAFVAAHKIDVVVDAWSLVKGPIVIERLEIDTVRINIEKNDAGDASWMFEGLEPESDSDSEETAHVRRLPIIVDHAAFRDIQASYSSPAFPEPQLFIAESILSSTDADVFQVELFGSLNGTPLHFKKTTSPTENLLNYENVNVEIDGNVGEIEIQGTAWIDYLLAPSRPRMALEIDGPNATYLTDLLSIQPITTGPLELSVSVAESGEQMVASLSGAFGEFDFEVDGRFQDIQELHNVDLDIVADGPDIGTIIRLSGRDYAESDPFEIRGRISRSGPELTIDNVLVVIGDSNLTVDGFFGEFPTPKGGRLSFMASGPDYGRFNRLFGMPGRLGGAFTTSLNLAPNGDGRTRVDFAANAPDIRVKLDGLLTTANNFDSTTMQLEISGPDVGAVAEAAGLDGLPAEHFLLTASVEKDPDGYLVRNLEALVGDDVLRFTGHIGDDPLGGETDIDIDFSGSNIGTSIVALGAPTDGLPKGTYYLRGSVQKRDGKLWLRDIRAAIGEDEEYQFQLSGFLTPPDGQFVDSQVSVRAQGASLAALAELAGQQGIPDFPFDIVAEIRRGLSNTHFEKGFFQSEDVVVDFAGHVGDKPLEDDMALTFDASVPKLKDVIAEFGFAVDKLPDGDLIASGSVRQKSGRISAERIEASLGGANLQVNGIIGQLPSLAGTRLEFELDGEDLSRLVPPIVDEESLHHAFAASGRVYLSGDELEVRRFRGNIGHTTFGGDYTIGLDPILGSGTFNSSADSPDVFQLFPELKEVSVPQVAKLKYRGSGAWADNFWSLENLRLELGEGYIEISGSMDGPPNYERTDLDVEWVASSVRKLSVIAGRELPDHPLRLKARFVGTRDVMTMENFELTFGESDLQGYFSMRAGDIPFLKIDVSSQLFDIREYLPEPEEEPQTEAPVADHRVIPDTALPLKFLRSFEADVDIDIDEVRTRKLNVRAFDFDALVSGGALNVQKLSFASLRGGHLIAAANLTPNKSGGADFTLTADGKDLIAGIRARTEQELQQLPLHDVRAELSASGETVRDFAGSLDGYFRVVGGAGRVPVGGMSLFTQDFITEVIGTINPFTKSDPYTNVECAVILLHFNHGVVEGAPALVQQTDKLRIFANARIDLRDEKLDVDFKMTPRKGLGLSISNLVNPYIKLTGTLGKPSLVVDPESVFIEGGVAVATAGLSILAKGFKDRFFSEKDPCGKALTAADEKFDARKNGG